MVRSWICAAARTCRAPAASSISSCSMPRAPIGAAMSAARCCSASTAPPGSARTTSRASGGGGPEDGRFRAKRMNCHMHILIYASQQRSYRDLPIRLAEIANVYRNERSGTLHGMLRVRGLSMDDAHIFLREDQIEEEIFNLLDIVELVMGKTFGLQYRLDLATRPDKKLGTDAMWDVAEKALEGALKRRGLTYRVDAGGGASTGRRSTSSSTTRSAARGRARRTKPT